MLGKVGYGKPPAAGGVSAAWCPWQDRSVICDRRQGDAASRPPQQNLNTTVAEIRSACAKASASSLHDSQRDFGTIDAIRVHELCTHNPAAIRLPRRAPMARDGHSMLSPMMQPHHAQEQARRARLPRRTHQGWLWWGFKLRVNPRSKY